MYARLKCKAYLAHKAVNDVVLATITTINIVAMNLYVCLHVRANNSYLYFVYILQLVYLAVNI